MKFWISERKTSWFQKYQDKAIQIAHKIVCWKWPGVESQVSILNIMWFCFVLRTYYMLRASLVAQTIRNLPALWETQVWSLDREDSLEKGMATHSSILAWRIPQTEEPGGLQSMELQRVGHDWATNTFRWRWGGKDCLGFYKHNPKLLFPCIGRRKQILIPLAYFSNNSFCTWASHAAQW